MRLLPTAKARGIRRAYLMNNDTVICTTSDQLLNQLATKFGEPVLLFQIDSYLYEDRETLVNRINDNIATYDVVDKYSIDFNVVKFEFNCEYFCQLTLEPEFLTISRVIPIIDAFPDNKSLYNNQIQIASVRREVINPLIEYAKSTLSKQPYNLAYAIDTSIIGAYMTITFLGEDFCKLLDVLKVKFEEAVKKCLDGTCSEYFVAASYKNRENVLALARITVSDVVKTVADPKPLNVECTSNVIGISCNSLDVFEFSDRLHGDLNDLYTNESTFDNVVDKYFD